MAVKNHVGLIAVATAATSTNSAVINAKSISWIANHDATNAITFNFEEGTDTSGAFMVGTGAIVTNIDIPVNTIYYDCTGASATFSLFGIAR